jgi:tetratricopeptide (TPR) repeat protein
MKKLLAVLLTLSALSFAQTGAVRGKVIGTDGNPVGKDTVYIQIDRTDIKGQYGVWTDKKGEYFHAGLPAGMYNVTAIAGAKVKNKPENGKEVGKFEKIRVPSGDPVEMPVVDMKAAEVAAAAAATAGGTGQAAAAAAAAAADATRGMSKEQLAEYAKQVKEREQAMAKNKELNEAFNAAMTAKEAKNYDEAVTQFNKATAMDATQHVVWANLAETHEAVGMSKTGADQTAAYDKAVEAWTKAIELKADDASYHNNFALLLAKNKKFPDAQAELDKAAGLNPAGAGMYYYNLGALYTNAGQIDPAGVAFKKAIDLDPNHADALYQYGIFLMSKAQTKADGTVVPVEGTVDAFQKYVALKPDGPFADSAKGMIQMLGAQLDTKYQNPDAKKNTPSAKPPANKKK